MAEVTRRRTGEHLRVLFQVLRENPDGMRARDALAELVNRVTLTAYETGEFTSGGSRFEKFVRFATVSYQRDPSAEVRPPTADLADSQFG